jgi:RNA polymerase sigma factor (sigma-70 family)
MTPVDAAFDKVRSESPDAFARWVGLVEIPLRVSLRRFAQQVDVEAIVQEGLLRMWRLAPRVELEGEDASLRYALRLVRNLALREAERSARFDRLELEGVDTAAESSLRPEPVPDPALRTILLDCLKRLPTRPRLALAARLESGGGIPDVTLAESLRMSSNTFLQNIVRARRHLAKCLDANGALPRELAP